MQTEVNVVKLSCSSLMQHQNKLECFEVNIFLGSLIFVGNAVRLTLKWITFITQK
jgi:hypothetical protein